MNDQIREELSEAANMTSQAYSNIRAGNTGTEWVCVYLSCVYIIVITENEQYFQFHPWISVYQIVL